VLPRVCNAADIVAGVATVCVQGMRAWWAVNAPPGQEQCAIPDAKCS
jgi:hypothetical protein